MIQAVWLTVNRRCNFRCLWCYAEGTSYPKDSDMTWKTASRLINISLGTGVKNFVILGGEPTFWEHLNTTCRYLTDADAKVTIVTNGWRYGDIDRAKSAIDTGAKVNISLKAGNPDQYAQLTKVRAYDRTLQALRNFAELGKPASVNITASALVTDNIEELAKVAIDNGANNVIVEFCSITFDENGQPQQGYTLHPQIMANKIVEKYELIVEAAGDNLSIMQTIPFCLYPEGFLKKLADAGHLMSGCHVIKRNGVIFTHDGGVLLCNCLHGFELGKLDVDFTDTETFKTFWHRREVIEANEQLVCYPHRRCMDCTKYNECCGGCPLQWFVFDPTLVLQEFQNEDFNGLENEHSYIPI